MATSNSRIVSLLLVCLIISFVYSTAIIDDIAAVQGVPFHSKVLAFLVDLIHVFISIFPTVIIAIIFVEIIVFKTFDIRKILFIDVFYITMVTGIVLFGMCPLTILYNKLLSVHACSAFSMQLRFGHDKDTRYNAHKSFVEDNPNCAKNTKAWMKGQTYQIMVVLTLNILFFLHSLITITSCV